MADGEDRTEDTNFDLCIVCQEKTKISVVKVPKLIFIEKLLSNIETRFNLKDVSVVNLYDRVKNFTAAELVKKDVVYHGECYKAITNTVQIDRARKRYEKALKNKSSSEVTPKRGRPCKRPHAKDNEMEVNEKVLRSGMELYAKDKCIICQKDGGHLHKVSYKNTGEKMLAVAEKLEDKSFFLRLNSIPNSRDAIANDVQYHRICWIYAQRKATPESEIQEIEDLSKVVADIEIINVITSELSMGTVLNMKDINTAYNSLLSHTEQEEVNYKRYLKKLIVDNIPDVSFTKPMNRNESEKVSLSSTKDAAADMTFKNTCDDLNLLFHAAKIIRNDLLHHEKWKFTGDLSNFAVSETLASFVKWVIVGPRATIHCDRRESDVNRAVDNISQLLIGAVKSRSQVTTKSNQVTSRGHYKTRETPFSVGLGLYIYHRTRSKDLLDCLSGLDLSISYEKALCIQNEMANAVCNVMDNNNGSYIPPTISKEKRVFFAIDNTDFRNDTADGKGEFHGTGMVVCQQHVNQEVTPLEIVREGSKSRNIRFEQDRFSRVLPCNAPKTPVVTYRDVHELDSSCLDKYNLHDMVWALRKEFDYCDEASIPTWAAYNSLTSESLPKTVCCGLPLLRGSPTDWSNLYTALKIVQNISVATSPESKTIVSLDLQLYSKCLQLNSKSDIGKNFIFRLGELHCVFAILKVMGKYIENSGLDYLLLESGVYGPVTLGQVLNGKHMKRAVEAHTVLYLSLFHFYVQKAIEVNGDLNSHLQQIFHHDSIQKHENKDHRQILHLIQGSRVLESLKAVDATFKMQPLFYRNYMRMIEHLLLFIRATRQGIWNLHLSSLEYFASLFFAHDQLNYARLTPVYINDMLALREVDPVTWKFFEDGNFCVNKNEVPFCAIGVDHAMEQQNKAMKVIGGIKGLTQFQSALDRYVIIAPQMTQLAEIFLLQNGLIKGKRSKHYQLTGSTNQRINKNIEKVKKTMIDFDLSFDETDCVFNIVTKAVVTAGAASDIVNHEEEGRQILKRYRAERLHGESSVWDKLKKRNILTFKQSTKMLKTKVNDKVISLREEKTLITRFLVMSRQRDEIDLPKLLGQYEFSVIPKALFSSDGKVLPCLDKSKIMHHIEDGLEHFGSKEQLTCEGSLSNVEKVLIIDGMALVNQVDMKNLKTCKDFADAFNRRLDAMVRSYKEVRLVFDRYVQESLKARTRDKRTSGVQIRYKIHDNAVISGISQKKFLSHVETKKELTRYLSMSAIDRFKKHQIKYVIVFESQSLSNLHNYPTELLQHDHEEADTLIVLHAYYVALSNPFAELHVYSPDTDVFLLLIFKYPELCSNTVFITGRGANTRNILLGECYELLGTDVSAALIGFHTFTGCDQIGRFNGKSKSAWWKAFRSASPEVIAALKALGETPALPALSVLEGLEKFVISAYETSGKNKFLSVAELRWHLFSRHSYDASKLPPTFSALKYRIFRSHYVTYVLKSCCKSVQNLPDPTGYGWELLNGRLSPITTDELPAPVSLIELSMCSCKGLCDTRRCVCHKNNLVCTDMCKCSDECKNDDAEVQEYEIESETDSDNDDYDYEP